jgi:hypothetical protein
MREGEAAQAGAPSVSRRGKSSAKSNAPFVERRRVPRPKLAEIRRGASLNLLPPSVVAGSVRIIEFLLVAVLGFAIYLAYVEREGMHSHIIYLVAALIAATATMLTFQAFNLYEIPAFSVFVRSFTRIFFAWSMVVVGMMALAFFGKVGADFSRVWIATWYVELTRWRDGIVVMSCWPRLFRLDVLRNFKPELLPCSPRDVEGVRLQLTEPPATSALDLQ